MKIIFATIDSRTTDAFSAHFAETPGVEVHRGDIFDHKADAIVSPANSFGFMDGGIDQVYSDHFGSDLGERLRKVIGETFEGELLVGQAVVIGTGDAGIPWLVSAPTMRVPMHVNGTVNVYLAFRAALRAVLRHNENIRLHRQNDLEEFLVSGEEITSVLCPSFGTGVGHMDPEVAAVQMRIAHAEVFRGIRVIPRSVHEAFQRHHLIARGGV